MLITLPDDSLLTIFASITLASVAAIAATSKQFCTLCRADSLWQRLAQSRWPHVQSVECMCTCAPQCAHPPVGADRTECSTCSQRSWRQFHRERARLPRWQHLYFRMDDIEFLLSARPKDWPKVFAEHLLAIGAGPVPNASREAPTYTPFDYWAARVAHALTPAVLAELNEWFQEVTLGLDVFYDYAATPQGSADAIGQGALTEALVAALRGLSALWLVHAYVGTVGPNHEVRPPPTFASPP